MEMTRSRPRRHDESRKVFQHVLQSPEALYREFVSEGRVHAALDAHLAEQADHSETLCLYLTVEIWLQQLFNGKWRDQLE